MGNCCKPASSLEWDGEDWSFMTSDNKSSTKVFDETRGHALNLGKLQKEKLMGALRASSSDASGKVTIRISKKELEELLEKQQHLNKKQVGRASAAQVLLRLKNARDHDARHRLWRPVLESIPEVS
ncbi:uncharacterized protein LOC109807713 [Cajanus cajan]|uniref:Uncharacterized protein n=1 Tax=Cajanus cajan TaxID=3821 RepID=A0A151STU9_CAJCA|nr:uncharacterized protein LOC109807713 [Cajanus cajan]KYP58189.1 hypothetical protein KK1_004482 [Cajanus cajan]